MYCLIILDLFYLCLGVLYVMWFDCLIAGGLYCFAGGRCNGCSLFLIFIDLVGVLLLVCLLCVFICGLVCFIIVV